jgi:hypothetical protein
VHITYLLDEFMRFRALVGATISRKTIFIEAEVDLQRLAGDSAIVEAALAKLLGEIVKNLDVMRDVASVMFRNDRNFSKRLAIDDILGLSIA